MSRSSDVDPDVAEFREAASAVVSEMRRSRLRRTPAESAFDAVLSEYRSAHPGMTVDEILAGYSPNEPEWDARIVHAYRAVLDGFGCRPAPDYADILSFSPSPDYVERYLAEWARLEEAGPRVGPAFNEGGPR